MTPLESSIHVMREILALAYKGLSAIEIARVLGLTVDETREAARVMGFELHEMVLSRDICPVCGYIMPPQERKKNGELHTPTCEVCSRRRRIDRMTSVIPAEQEKYEALMDRQLDALKQEQRRARLGTAEQAAVGIVSAMYQLKPLYLTNPRSRKDEWYAFEQAAVALLTAVQQAKKGGDRTEGDDR